VGKVSRSSFLFKVQKAIHERHVKSISKPPTIINSIPRRIKRAGCAKSKISKRRLRKWNRVSASSTFQAASTHQSTRCRNHRSTFIVVVKRQSGWAALERLGRERRTRTKDAQGPIYLTFWIRILMIGAPFRSCPVCGCGGRPTASTLGGLQKDNALTTRTLLRCFCSQLNTKRDLGQQQEF
jgi:hypothetical protein